MRKSRIVFSAILMAGLVAVLLGCGGTRKNDPEVAMRSQKVQLALGEIASTLAKYHTDKGFFPKGMATLREEGYLTVDPDLEKEWTFNYFTDGPVVTLVEARSTKEMPDGADYRITYRPADSRFEGYGIDKFPRGHKKKG